MCNVLPPYDLRVCYVMGIRLKHYDEISHWCMKKKYEMNIKERPRKCIYTYAYAGKHASVHKHWLHTQAAHAHMIHTPAEYPFFSV